MAHKESMGKHLFRTSAVLLLSMVKAAFGAEVRDVALGGNSCTAKEYYIITAVNYLFQSWIHGYTSRHFSCL